VKTFKLSNDKRFVEKVQDIVGLYLDPPDKALVFSVDEKSQIQALDRTQPSAAAARFSRSDSRGAAQNSRHRLADRSAHASSCNSALASIRSGASKPSVNRA
jgi:hypothetical protein